MDRYSGFYNNLFSVNNKVQDLSFCDPILVMQRQSSGGDGSVVNEINLPLGFPWKNRHLQEPFLQKNTEVKPIPIYVEKYKTEICHFQDDYQKCPYGDTCQYAHDLSELRPQKLHQKYKSTLCNKFVHGYCPYGRRCTYKHQSPEIKQYIVKKIKKENNQQPEFECVPFFKKPFQSPQEEQKNQTNKIQFESENQVELLKKEDYQFESIFESVIQDIKNQSVFSILRQGVLPQKKILTN